MNIKRDKYLNDLINRMHNGMIKVVTGIRRSGKSYLIFKIFYEYLLSQGTKKNHIISIELDRRENKKYCNPDYILEYIKSCLKDNKEYYILIDEIQLLDDFESVLNSLLHMHNVDIYVTGSNSKFLSKDIITEFRGRGDEVHVYPLSFNEFMSVYNGDVYNGFADYMIYGGLPLVSTMKTEEQKVAYLSNLFAETYIKDIVNRNKIEKTQELEDIISILASSIGSLTNPSRLEATFKSRIKSNICLNTIFKYIEYLKDAFIVCEAKRYDVKGRKYIGSPIKYYFEDVGLRNAKLGFSQIEKPHLMENVVFNELRYRGYNVDVGIVEKRVRKPDGKLGCAQLEIDFVANLGSKRYYIQSAYAIPDEEKRKQETASLLNVNDSFKKIIVVNEVTKVTRDINGITTMSLYDFLLNPNSLDL